MKKIILTIFLLTFCVSISGAGITDKLRAVIAAKNAGGAPPSGKSFSDDFSTDPFTSRFGYLTSGTFYFAEDAVAAANQSAGSAIYYNVGQTDTTNQYVKISSNESGYCGVAFRSDGTGSNGYYAVFINANNATFDLWDEDGVVSEIEDLGAVTYTAGTPIGVTICGSGASTVVRLWLNVTADAPSTCALWDAGGPDKTSSTDPGTYYDSNKYLGIANRTWSREYDNFFGGDVP